jgi:GTP pyrophosphokinase
MNKEQNKNIISPGEKDRIISQLRSFIDNCKFCLTEEDKAKIYKAFDIAYIAHENQKLENGKPYIYHQLEVANIVTNEIGLGPISIISSLLHEVVTAGAYTINKIEKEFGKEIAFIVNGLTKVSGIDKPAKAVQAEYYRRLIVTMSSDIRVILIKIADRLQNMRTLQYKSPDRQLQLALETSFLYAPFAQRLGLYNIKNELDDIALKFLDPEAYTYIENKLAETTATRNIFIKNFIKPIDEKLKESNFKFEIKSRTKSISSIWNKMKKQNVDFDQIYDIFAIRIIINTDLKKEKEDCWRVYSIVTELYKPNPSRLRDWISIPKSNGYESLHTTVLGPEGKWVEVQIRTVRMDEIAERGYAAHYLYKGVKESNRAIENWLSNMREIIDNSENNLYEIIDNVKLNLYNDEVFVFTPKGDLKKLPVNSTVLDFAYEIHSKVGDHCVGARINNRNVTIREKLQNGDQIEIYTAKTQKPSSDWLNYVVTSKAKAKIKIALREEKMKEAEIGKEIIKRRFKNWKIDYVDENINKILEYYNLQNAIDFYHLVAQGKISLLDIKNILTSNDQSAHSKEITIKETELKEQEYNFLSDDFIIIEEKIKNIDYKLARCCNPVFGDPIFGFVSINEGIKIHRFNCPNAPRLLTKYAYRVVKAKWTASAENKAFQTIIKITATNEPGLLSQITDVVAADKKIILRSLSVENNEGLFEGLLKVFVSDVKQLDGLIKRILKVKGVIKALRTQQES